MSHMKHYFGIPLKNNFKFMLPSFIFFTFSRVAASYFGECFSSTNPWARGFSLFTNISWFSSIKGNCCTVPIPASCRLSWTGWSPHVSLSLSFRGYLPGTVPSKSKKSWKLKPTCDLISWTTKEEGKEREQSCGAAGCGGTERTGERAERWGVDLPQELDEPCCFFSWVCKLWRLPWRRWRKYTTPGKRVYIEPSPLLKVIIGFLLFLIEACKRHTYMDMYAGGSFKKLGFDVFVFWLQIKKDI